MKETSSKFGFWPEIGLLIFFLTDVFFNLVNTVFDWDSNSPVIEMIVLDPEPEDRFTTQLCDFENSDTPVAHDFPWQAQLL